MFVVQGINARMWVVAPEFITRFLNVVGHAHNQDVLADLALDGDELAALAEFLDFEDGVEWMMDTTFLNYPVVFRRLPADADELMLVEINPAEMALLY